MRGTGWVTDEDPAVHAVRKAEEGVLTALDPLTRRTHRRPIFVGRLTDALWGQFLKIINQPW